MSAEAQTITAPLFLGSGSSKKQHGLVVVRAENVKESNSRVSFQIKTENLIAKASSFFNLVKVTGATHIEIRRA